MFRNPFKLTWISLAVPPLFVIAVLSHYTPSSAQTPKPGIVGSWVLTISPNGAAKNKALVTNTADGIMIEVASAPLTNAPPGLAGLGTWTSTGGNKFKSTIVFLLTDAHGQYTGLFTARTVGTVSGNTLKGSSTVAFSDSQGNVVGRGTSTMTGVRTDSAAQSSR